MAHRRETPDFAHIKKSAFLSAYIKLCSITRAAKHAKINRRTHYDWLANDPEYVSAFRKAKEQAIDALEDQLADLAYGGNVVALIFRLKGERPDKYNRETVKHVGPGPDDSISVTHGFTTAAERILAELRGIAARTGTQPDNPPDPGA